MRLTWSWTQRGQTPAERMLAISLLSGSSLWSQRKQADAQVGSVFSLYDRHLQLYQSGASTDGKPFVFAAEAEVTPPVYLRWHLSSH